MPLTAGPNILVSKRRHSPFTGPAMASAPDIAEALDRCRHLIRRLRDAGFRVPVESIRGDIEDLDRCFRQLQGLERGLIPQWNDLFTTEWIWGGLGGRRSFLTGIGQALERLSRVQAALERMQTSATTPASGVNPDALTELIRQRTLELSELEQTLENRRSDAEAAENRLRSLQERVQQIGCSLEIVREQFAQEEKQREQLSSEIASLRAELQALRHQESEAGQLTIRIAELQEQLHLEEQALVQKRDLCVQEEERLQQLQTMLVEVETAFGEKRQEYRNLLDLTGVEQSRLERYREGVEKFRVAGETQRIDLEEQIRERIAQLAAVRAELAETDSDWMEVPCLAREIADLRRQRDSLRQEAEAVRAELTDLRIRESEYQILTARLGELQEQVCMEEQALQDLRCLRDTEVRKEEQVPAAPGDTAASRVEAPAAGPEESAVQDTAGSASSLLPEKADALPDSLAVLGQRIAGLSEAVGSLGDCLDLLATRQQQHEELCTRLMEDSGHLEESLRVCGQGEAAAQLMAQIRNERFRLQGGQGIRGGISLQTKGCLAELQKLRAALEQERRWLDATVALLDENGPDGVAEVVQQEIAHHLETCGRFEVSLEKCRVDQTQIRHRQQACEIRTGARQSRLEDLRRLAEPLLCSAAAPPEAVPAVAPSDAEGPELTGPPDDPLPEAPDSWFRHQEEACGILKRLGVSLVLQDRLPYSVVLVRHTVADAEILPLLRAGIRVFLCSSVPVPALDAWFREWGTTRLLDLSDAPASVAAQTLSGTDDSVLQVLQQLAEASVTRPFNLDQYRVEHAPPEQDLMVTAGAGTGKTTVMIQRIFHLMNEQPDLLPGGVAMVTFTREASRVMRERLRATLARRLQLTANPRYRDWLLRLRELHVSTFHAFGRRLLTELAPLMGLSGSITVSSNRQERRELLLSALEEVCRQTGADGRPRLPAALKQQLHDVIDLLQRTWDQLENRGASLEQMPAAVDWGLDGADPGSAEVGRIFRDTILHAARQARDRNNRAGCMTISDLNLRLSSVDEQLFAAAGDRLPAWRFLFIDEFQDTDDAQIRLSVLLRRRLGVPLFVVGDIKQSIYRFRGADYTAFQRLQKELGEIAFGHYSLCLNYRTAGPILERLNPVFREWAARQYLHFDATRDVMRSAVPAAETAEPRLQVMTVGRNDVQLLLRNVWNRHPKGETVAVLTRTNRQCREISGLLGDAGIPHRVSGKGQLLQHPAAVDLGILVRALTHQGDRQATADLLASPWNPRPVAWAGLLGGAFPEPVECLGEAWEHLLRIAASRTSLAVLAEAVRLLRPTRQYVLQLGRQDVPEAEIIDRGCTYQAALDRLLSLLHERMGAASLRQIGQWLAVQRYADDRHDVPESLERGALLQCMTIHQAKGDEFDTVLLPMTGHGFLSQLTRQEVLVTAEPAAGWRVGWSIGDLSAHHREALQQSEEDETIREESRLLYVALTRARKRLVIGLAPKGGAVRPDTQAALLRLGGLAG